MSESKIEVLEDDVKEEVKKVVTDVKQELDKASPAFKKLFTQEIISRLDALINFAASQEQGNTLIYRALLEMNLLSHKLLLGYNSSTTN